MSAVGAGCFFPREGRLRNNSNNCRIVGLLSPTSLFPCRHRRSSSSSSGLLQVSSAALILSMMAGGIVPVCDAQADNSIDRTEDGTERGPNSRLAAQVEAYMPAIVGGLVLLLVIVFCGIKVRAAIRAMGEGGEEEAGVADAEARFGAARYGEKEAAELFPRGVERIARTKMVFDEKKTASRPTSIATATSSTRPSSTSSSTSSQGKVGTSADEGSAEHSQSGQHDASSSSARPASKLSRV